ncbi:hypothetical protein TVAG_456850 [Trichomonas vaginalis G3]|uniref:Uncharacterized protein n=1 Tax=Trichomonas vaginalis (strain ATCC PRA-98 / G3) TaxID=412133 RepID=A2DC09_TRIV3|nr:armadillo (ARM) repeat-containing protein family [Trichomonas vaginalis G3]EAY22050.1 hypothetical protein TVAG_456850 [Trichomonas vaginalis G3]KAI5525323.1 armadillo (ARM) repeat-containing protein family [Trichomonas vaginalis G3]|eukprot:XP_001583036.1 hypothetical protein [Trichomonas vaginalis G3]
MEINARILDLFSRPNLPDASDEVIDLIESFLISGFDSLVKAHIQIIIEFLCQTLPTRSDYQTATSQDVIDRQSRCMELIHIIKPIYLTPITSGLIEEKLIKVLNFEGRLQQQAFSILVDHFSLAPRGQPDRIPDFLKFYQTYLKLAVTDINKVDHNLFLLILAAFISVIVYEKHDLHTIMPYYDTFIHITNGCLVYADSPDFFPYFEQICAKALRVISRLYEQTHTMPVSALTSLIDIGSKISKDLKFMHIYLNYLYILSSIYSHTDENLLSIVSPIVEKEIIDNLSYFAIKPFIGQRRFLNMLSNLAKGINERILSQPNSIEKLLSNVYKLLSLKVWQAIQILRKICDHFKINPAKLGDVLEQLMSILELILDDYDDSPEQWAEINNLIIKMINTLFGQFFQPNLDEKNTKTDILSRFTHYNAKLLDLMGKILNNNNKDTIIFNGKPFTGQLKLFRRTIQEIFSFYCDIIIKLPVEWSQSFFRDNVKYYLPSADCHTFNTFLVSRFLPKLQNPSAFIIAAINHTIENINSLNKLYVEFLYKVILDTFVQESPININPEQNEQLCTAIFNLFLEVLDKNCADLVETFNGLFKIYSRRQTNSRLVPFVQMLNKAGGNWGTALIPLQPELVFSRLAINMFPAIDSPKNIDAWFNLFLPDLETDEGRKKDLVSFAITMKTKNFAALFKELKKQTKFRLLNCLSHMLSQSTNPQEIDQLRPLLNTIADFIPIAAEEQQTIRPSYTKVTINGKIYALDIILDTYKQCKKDSLIDFMFELVQKAFDQLSYQEICQSKVVREIVNIICQNNKDKFTNNLPDNFTGHFFRYLIFDELTIEDDRVYDFLHESSFLFFNVDTVKYALDLTDKLIDKVPFDKKWLTLLSPILQSSQNEYKRGFDIIYQHLIVNNANNENCPEVFSDLYKQCFYLSRRSSYSVRKVVNPILINLGLISSIQNMYSKHRQDILNKIQKALNIPNNLVNTVRVYFNFLRTFDDCPFQQELFDTFYTYLTSQAPPEERFLFYSDKYQMKIIDPVNRGSPLDPSISIYKLQSFIYKVIARLSISCKNESLASLMFYKTFQLFNDKKNRPWVNVYLRNLQKGVKAGFGTFDFLPKDLTKIMHFTPPKLRPSKTDLRILKFAVETQLYNDQTEEIVKYLIAALQALKIDRKTKLSTIEWLSSFIFDIIEILPVKTKTVKSENEQPASFQSLINNVIETVIYYRIQRPQLKLNACKVFKKYSYESAESLFNFMIQKDYTTISLMLLNESSNIRELFLFSSFAVFNVHKYFKEQKPLQNPDNVLDIYDIVNRTLRVVANSINFATSPEERKRLKEMAIRLYTYFAGENDNFKPSMAYNIINCLITDKDELNILPFFLSSPQCFLHEVIVKKLANYYLNYKNGLTNIIEMEKKQINHPNKTYIKIFLFSLLNQMFKDNKSDNLENVTFSYSNLDNDSHILLRYLYVHSVCLTYEYDFVSIENIMNCPIIYNSHDVHKLLIKRGNLKLETCITTNRLVHVINDGIQLNDSYEIMRKRLVYFPFFNSHSQNILRLMSLFPEKYPMTERWCNRFLVGLLMAFAVNTPNNQTIQAIRKFISYYRNFAKFMNNDYKAPLFSVLSFFFLQMKDQAQNQVHLIFSDIHSDVEIQKIDMELIKQFKDYMAIIPAMDNNQWLSQLSFKFLVISHLSKFLFANNDYFPQILLLSNIFSSQMNLDIMQYYKVALKEVSKFGGEIVTGKIISDLYKYLVSQNKKFSEPKSSSFATVLCWSDECQGDVQFTKLFDNLIDALKPQDLSHLLYELPQLKLPLNADHFSIIEKLIEEFKPSLNDPVLMYYDSFVSKNESIDNLWQNSWSLQHEASHLYVFSKYFYNEKEISNLINYIPENKMKQMMAISLEKLDINRQLNRFIMYYTKMFPNSSLSEVFYTTVHFLDQNPLPNKNFFQNAEFLNNVTMTDDSLGVYILQKPQLKNAIRYHQLCHFEAARGLYLNEMFDKKDEFSLILNLMRPVLMNLDFAFIDTSCQTYINLPNIPSYALNLPMIKLYTPENELHAAIKDIYYPDSKFFLPSLLSVQRLTIFDESISLLRCVSKNPMDQAGITKWSIIGLTTLDKNCAAISNIGFKINQIRAREKQLFRSSQNFAFVNSNFAASLLSSSNAMKKACKLFTLSLQPPEITQSTFGITNNQQPQDPQNSQPQNPQFERDLRYGLQFNIQSVSRIYNMLSRIPQAYTQTIPALKTRLYYFLAIHDVSGFMKQFNFKQLSSQNYHLKLLIFMFTNFPNEINVQTVYQVIAQRIIPQNFVPQSLEYTNMALGLAFAIVKKNPQTTNLFYQHIFGCFKQDQATVWFIWLPHILSTFDNPPIDFLKKVMMCETSRFRSILRNALGSETCKSQKFCEEATKSLGKMQEGSTLHEYDQSLMWAHDIEDDIDNYYSSVGVHMKLAEEIASDRYNFEVSPTIKQITGEDVLKYVIEHPPYFKTNKTTIEPYGSTYFRFPALTNQCFHAYIDAPGDKEATMTFVMVNGQTMSFSLICSLLFKPNFSEEIFLYVSRFFIKNHPAFKFRSAFISHAQLYYIHKQLLMMAGGSYCGLGEITRTQIILELLKRKGETGREPFAVKSRKIESQDIKKSVYQWLFSYSEGSKLDFIFMRESISSHISAISAIKFLFMSGYPQYPTILFSTNRCKVSMPRLTHSNHKVCHLPMTQTISEFIPPYVMNGSFSSTWLLVIESFSRNLDKLKIYIKALVEHGEKTSEIVSDRVRKSSLCEMEDTEKEQNPMPFAVLDHLIATSKNAFNCQETGFAWV